MNEEVSQTRSRKVFLTLVAIVVVPIVAAYVAFFYLPAIIPSGTTNEGTLITPPLDARTVSPDLLPADTWLLMQPVDINCSDDCQQLLYLSRQVVTGLGKNSDRVNRVLLTSAPISDGFSALVSKEHQDLDVIQVSHEKLDEITAERPVLFLMDPNGNIMMYYSLDKAGKPMLKDLKHLLKVSNIG